MKPDLFRLKCSLERRARLLGAESLRDLTLRFHTGEWDDVAAGPIVLLADIFFSDPFDDDRHFVDARSS